MNTSVNASGKGDGIVEIPDNIDPIDRCIEVNVEVKKWVVTLITPEFNQ
jgi:hypothetical protein